ncbi:MAG: flagellar hook-basal body protein [Epsilonproteobacteria bacterium]|nr:flagellar hook-basal body protein [Campylobacterota bacterium]
MQSGYYDVAGGMVTQFNRLDVISNNLANLNTTAFKKDDVIIGDFKRIFQNAQDNMPIANNTREGAKFLNASIDGVPQVVEQYTKFTQNGMKNTGNNLDFALKNANSFFMVKTPSGIRLTQDGSFVVNGDGVLSTKEGYPVLPADYFTNSKLIKIPANSTFSVGKGGGIYINGDNAGKMFIATTDDMKSLQKEGSNLFKFPNINAINQTPSQDIIAQGFLETSNVNPVSQMIGLIEANRMVEMYQKVMNSQMNDLNTDAINKLASVRA